MVWLWDGGEVPGVDADVYLPVLLAPFLVDVAVEQPVFVVLGAPLRELHVVAGVEFVGEVVEVRGLAGDGVGLGVVEDLVDPADVVVISPLSAVVFVALPAPVVVSGHKESCAP